MASKEETKKKATAGKKPRQERGSPGAAKKPARGEKEVKPKVEEAPVVAETIVPADVAGVDEFVLPEDKRDDKKPDRYFEAVGRRKTAVARVRLFTRSGDFTVNQKLYGEYFPTLELQKIVEDALQKMKLFGRFRVSVKLSGGGSHSQAEALRHGLARCLLKFNPDFRKRLKRAGYLKRDPRMKERKKFGLKKARRAPQWSKR